MGKYMKSLGEKLLLVALGIGIVIVYGLVAPSDHHEGGLFTDSEWLEVQVELNTSHIRELTVKDRGDNPKYGFEPDGWDGMSYGYRTITGAVPWMEGSAIDTALKWYQKDTLRIITDPRNKEYLDFLLK